MQLSICNDLFKGWSEKDIFQFVADKGFDGIEIAPFMYADNVKDISAKTRLDTKKLASLCGLEIVGLHWVLVGPQGLHLTGNDRTVRERTRDYILRLIEYCGDIGGSVIIFGSPQQRNLNPGVDIQDGYKYAAEVFGECMEYAVDRGVVICIETLGSNETNFINKIDEAVKLVKMVSHPNFQTMVDIKAALTEERAVNEVIIEAAEHLYHVHLNDINGIAPGFGPTDFGSIVDQLKKISYDRYLSFEIFELPTGIEETTEKCFNYLKQYL